MSSIRIASTWSSNLQQAAHAVMGTYMSPAQTTSPAGTLFTNVAAYSIPRRRPQTHWCHCSSDSLNSHLQRTFASPSRAGSCKAAVATPALTARPGDPELTLRNDDWGASQSSADVERTRLHEQHATLLRGLQSSAQQLLAARNWDPAYAGRKLIRRRISRETEVFYVYKIDKTLHLCISLLESN